MNAILPILRWAGSKRAIVGNLKDLWGKKYSVYIEPFCGSATLFFFLAPHQAILSDLNLHLIEFYETCKSHPSNVYDKFYEISRDEKTYYNIRQNFGLEDDCIEHAANFLYLNRNCFNGLFRTNREGMFNVPFASNRVASYPTRDAFLTACSLLSIAEVQCADFDAVVREHLRENAFVYMDPPYATTARVPFKEYYPGSFTPQDGTRLVTLLHDIEDAGAFFVLSYGASIAHLGLRPSWRHLNWLVQRRISGLVSGRGKAVEHVITNIEFGDA